MRLGRLPPCSCPTGRPYSTQSTSPASGLARLTIGPLYPHLLIARCYVAPIVIDDLGTNIGAPIDKRRLNQRPPLFRFCKKLLDRIPLARHTKLDNSVPRSDIHFLAL